MPDEQRHRLTLHVPHDLHEAAQGIAKERYISLTALILQAMRKEIDADAFAKKGRKP